MKILDIGCGRRRLPVADGSELIRLDQMGNVDPDIICKLGEEQIPLPDNSIDIVVAIHVLEHIGKQGETAEWFALMEDIYRVLKPGGTLEFESPWFSSVWAWADPSHTRALSPEAFIFFSQDNYRVEGSAITPFRIQCDFTPLGFELAPKAEEAREEITNFRGKLVAIKPLKPWWEDAEVLDFKAAAGGQS